MTATTDAAEWLHRWDVQQQGYIHEREGRFTAITEVLSALVGDLVGDSVGVSVLDLGCGPGSTTDRVLRALPAARVVAVDLDPVLLELARRTAVDPARVVHIEADLGEPGWPTALHAERPENGFDAIVSTTALHWLGAGALVELYRTAHDLLRPGGVLLNGDHMRYGSTQPTLAHAAQRLREIDERRTFTEAGVPDYATWHTELRAAMPDLPWDERERRFAGRRRHGLGPSYDLHHSALRDAGFSEVDTIWQHRDNRVIIAVKAG